MMIRSAITPKLLVQLFPDKESFKDWADDLLLHDLRFWLKEFEREEEYEHCAILRDAIKEFERANEIIRLHLKGE